MASTDQAASGNAGWDSAQAAAGAFGYPLHPDYVARLERERRTAPAHTHPRGVICSPGWCGSEGPNAAVLDGGECTDPACRVWH